MSCGDYVDTANVISIDLRRDHPSLSLIGLCLLLCNRDLLATDIGLHGYVTLPVFGSCQTSRGLVLVVGGTIKTHNRVSVISLHGSGFYNCAKQTCIESMDYPKSFDVIVIGGGHAGVEAALAAARVGASVLLLTQSIETIGQMSCNPAIGGIGKSHLVREIDALGGVMAVATDEAGIQFRTLNMRKGPAVRATRAQADRVLYKTAIRNRVEATRNLSVFQDTVVDLEIDDDQISGVITRTGLKFSSHAVVLTTGTFLGGRIFIGTEQHEGGRAGDPASTTLSKRLRDRPFRVGRLKTGTPPRIDGNTVDFSRLSVQHGDEPRPVMSYLGKREMHPRQVPCHVTRTNSRTHEIIKSGLDRSPMYSGVIEGVGPRYCPSIEDKVVRFAERDNHQIFVEPEGLTSTELYPNGISTSLPFSVQLAAVQTIEGFEYAHITRPGYAIEYDFFDPRDLLDSFETRLVEGLFFAGQINGTTGYEEAAAQGLLAGLNAALKVAGRISWSPARHEAYMGVLIDDLTSLGTNEPYRMFTSRAEFRLRLRQDNADFRLTPKGRELGLVDDERWSVFQARKEAVDRCLVQLHEMPLRLGGDSALLLKQLTGEEITNDTNLASFVRRPAINATQLMRTGWFGDEVDSALEQAIIELKYEGYIRRQELEIHRSKEHDEFDLPANLDYGNIEGLSNELKEKLSTTMPLSLSKAARIPGMTPAALALVSIHAKRGSKKRKIA